MVDAMIKENLYAMYVLFSLFSLAMGSLLNAVIYRLPIMIQNEWHEHCCAVLQVKKKNKNPTLNLFLPRSFCPECKSLITVWQNIPLVSYLLLKGRCYQCQHPIPLRYPLVELLTLLLSLYASVHFGFQLKLLFVLLAIYLLLLLFFIDIEHQLLPDSLNFSLLWLGLLANTQDLFASLKDAVFGVVLGYLSLWCLIKLYYLIRGKTGMGHGDFKLFAALGAWFGWFFLPLILLFSSLIGLFFGLLYLKAKQKSFDTRIAFGPFLCLSGLILLLCLR